MKEERARYAPIEYTSIGILFLGIFFSSIWFAIFFKKKFFGFPNIKEETKAYDVSIIGILNRIAGIIMAIVAELFNMPAIEIMPRRKP